MGGPTSLIIANAPQGAPRRTCISMPTGTSCRTPVSLVQAPRPCRAQSRVCRKRAGDAAAAVAGTIAGLWQLQRLCDSLAWSDLLAPAIRYAREGFRVGRILTALR